MTHFLVDDLVKSYFIYLWENHEQQLSLSRTFRDISVSMKTRLLTGPMENRGSNPRGRGNLFLQRSVEINSRVHSLLYQMGAPSLEAKRRGVTLTTHLLSAEG